MSRRRHAAHQPPLRVVAVLIFGRLIAGFQPLFFFLSRRFCCRAPLAVAHLSPSRTSAVVPLAVVHLSPSYSSAGRRAPLVVEHISPSHTSAGRRAPLAVAVAHLWSQVWVPGLIRPRLLGMTWV
ncbi:hypothetical protein Dsin_005865 [Dipteronia sinensis]|uniref:Uncharacterized protein n=1 Tax=Dipteronia sinensis TaxID=43782 RepID=A0AAE0AXA3_9ROSI|nr:hypothetical protein Dsin_005865 [Dipteronia sinensis]